ncbi:hypothetical protein [Nocardia sp. NPDC050412]|uniref:hypothetical protein n=1 Tax=Nocardia sp. NPDC050412 TaxID=3364320 RepID=UPI0037B5776B
MNPTPAPDGGDSDPTTPTTADAPRVLAAPVVTDIAVLEKFLTGLQTLDIHNRPTPTADAEDTDEVSHAPN